MEVEPSDGGVRAKEVVGAKGTAGGHNGTVGRDEAGLGNVLRIQFQPFAPPGLADMLKRDDERQLGLTSGTPVKKCPRACRSEYSCVI